MPQSRSLFRVVVTGACAALALGLPPGAAAQAPGFEPCGSDGAFGRTAPPGSSCGRVVVPLDHSGRVPGRIGLATAILPSTGPRAGTVVILTGGPGQAATPLAGSLGSQLAPLRTAYDLVLVDQRGTGASDAVDCPSTSSAEGVRRCAEALGPRRAFWTTRETALDVEDVRVALGAKQLTLYGVSYGAAVAGEYARRFPATTAGLVLDSPDRVNGSDVTNSLRQFGLPRVLREVCFPPGCEFLSDPTVALASLVRRLRQGPLRGRAVLPSGRTRAARVTVDDLYSLVVSSDMDPVLRSELPAAIASGVLRDPAPLLRLLTAGTARGGEEDGSDGMNEARFLATSCVEGTLPWDPESPVAARRDALARAVAATPRYVYAPFGPSVVVRNSLIGACAEWPSTPKPEGVAEQGPDVPVLVLSGREDLRTPLEDARRTAARYPRARVLAVPGVGHSVLGSDPSNCAIDAVADFLGGRPVARCARIPRRSVPRAPFLPAALGDLLPAAGLPTGIGRIATATRVTLLELARLAANAGEVSEGRLRIPGLRGGRATSGRGRLTLAAFEVIRGVRVSGTISGEQGRLTVSTRVGTTGALRKGGDGRIRGTIGGRSVSFRVR